MGIAEQATEALGHAIRNVHAGAEKLISRKVAAAMPPQIVVTSPAFVDEGKLPLACTVDGAGTPPALGWNFANAGALTKSFVLVCEDPDAPFPEPFVHWIVYAIPPSATLLDARTIAQAREGKNSRLDVGFTAADPPPGHGLHHYHFQVLALDVETDFEPGLGRSALIAHLKNHVIAWGEIVGTYERK